MATRKDAARTHSVFINCPFDNSYQPLFEALIFRVQVCGFTPRCALEEIDSGENRLEKIKRIIKACGLSVHDISRIEINQNGLPRFNMPFELGLDLGCKSYGDRACKRKRVLILDAERYRYQQTISDVGGQDISIHENNVEKLLKVVRDWLDSLKTTKRPLPGPAHIRKLHRKMVQLLPVTCDEMGLVRDEPTFIDYVNVSTAILSHLQA